MEPARMELAEPTVFRSEERRLLRFCVDCRKLIAATKRDSYPISLMDEFIDSLGKAAVFSTLDANSDYWQVNVVEVHRDKKAFSSHQGLYRFLRMAFGLKMHQEYSRAQWMLS